MKNIIFALVLCFLAVQCKKDTIEISFPPEDFEIPGNLNTLLLYNFNIPQINGTTTAADKVLPNLFRIQSVDGLDLNFIDAAWVYISADSLPEVEVAYLENINTNTGSSINLLPGIANVKSYIVSPKFNFRVRLRLRTTYSAPIRARLTYSFQQK